MPKIHLKEKSPEFQDIRQARTRTKPCQMPGCPSEGTFRAPKDRSLSDHYWFCQGHISEYNRAWNFFEGMNPKEVEDHILKSMFGDRPTWRHGEHATEDDLRQRAWDFYGKGENPDDRAGRAYEEYDKNGREFDRNSAEYEAMLIFNLEPPLDLAVIKKRYKELAMKHHPDRNKGSSESEELLKKINISYTVLKLAFQRYDTLEKEK